MLRRAVTRTVNEIDTFSVNSSPTNLGELEERFSILQNKDVSLAEVDEETEVQVEDGALVTELQAAEDYGEIICVTRTRIARKLEALRTSDINTTTATDTTELQRVPLRHVTTYVKLPKLEIMKFEENVQH